MVVVSSAADQHARHVVNAIERAGAEVCYLDPAMVPERLPLSWTEERITLGERSLEEIRSVYIKSVRYSLPVVDPRDAAERAFCRWQDKLIAERERHAFLGAILRNFRVHGATVVNPLETFDLHFMKPYQLAVLFRAGFPVPKSVATCDPEAVQTFAAKFDEVIYKPIGGGAHVRLLTESDLTPERLGLLCKAPVLFQERIPGREFRAYVLDGEPVQAFEVPTAEHVDVRANLRHTQPASLPENVWEACVRAADHLGLVFSGIDLRIRPDESFAILELNPTPAISFYDDPVEGVVITRLADFLVRHA